MKAFVLSLALLGSWRHGAALTAEPGSAAAESDHAEQGDDTDVRFEQDENTGGVEALPALDKFMAPYDQKLESMTHEADELKGKLMAFRTSSMARLTHKKKDYQQRLHEAKRENRRLAKSNEELDKEVIRLQHQVAKKAAHLQNVQDANRKSKQDMEQLAKDLEVVDRIFDKSIDAAKTKAEEVIKADSTVVEPSAPILEKRDELEQAPDPVETQFLRSASSGNVEAMPSFDREEDNDEEGIDEDDEPTGTAAKQLSMLSKSISVTTPQTQTDLTDFEPASLLELLTRNLASLQKHEESSETALWDEFKKRVKQTFHERRQLRKREGALLAMKKKLTKYEEQMDVYTKKAEHVQEFLADEVNKESNYLRKVKKHLH